MKNLAQAILQVMDEVKGIEKNTTVGSGQMSYKGVSDKDVKTKIGAAMLKAGLAIIPKDINSKVDVTRYEEVTQYGTKQKQVIFTEAVTRYTLLHVSGESIEVAGYGHGVDSQDKSAGKATTYALKNALLYLFMVPTGTLPDTDTTHSDDLPTPPAAKPTLDQVLKQIAAAKALPELTAIFNANKHLNTIEPFMSALSKRKLELTKP